MPPSEDRQPLGANKLAHEDLAGAGDMGPRDVSYIEAARAIGSTLLGPNAEAADQAQSPRLENLTALAEAGLMGIALPQAVGGSDLSGEAQRLITETLASYCGVTTFTWAQHHGSSSMVAAAPDEGLRRLVAPELAAGRMICAISFAHLRRPGAPVLRAEPVRGGWRLFGSAPWVTGWGLMNQVVLGAALPDNGIAYLWAPASRADFRELFEGVGPPEGDWGALHVSPPLRLCAMNASSTVELSFQGLFVPDRHCVAQSDRARLVEADRRRLLGVTALHFGCTAGAVRLLCTLGERRGSAVIREAAARFQREWTGKREEVRALEDLEDSPDRFQRAVRLRAGVLDLAMRTSRAAVAASGGSAMLMSHPAQRFAREALFYTIQAQTQEVMGATLELLQPG